MLIEQGRYRGVICDHGFNKTSTDKDQLVLTFSLIGKLDPSRPDAMDPAPDANRSIFRVLTEKTIDYAIQDLRGIGWRGDSFAELDLASGGNASLCGTEIDVLCTHEDYQGKVQERWSLAGRRGLELKPADSKTVMRLDAKFGKLLKQKPATAQPLGVPTKTKPKAKAAPAAEVKPAWEADDAEMTATTKDCPF